MGQERYTAEISVPTTVVVLPLQQRAAYFFPYNTSTLSTPLPYNASVARLCALCPSRYLDRIWLGTNWKSPKYAHVPIRRLFCRGATNVTLSQCPLLWRKCLLQSSLWEVPPLPLPVHIDKLLWTTGPESVICGQHLYFSTKKTSQTWKWNCGIMKSVEYQNMFNPAKKCKVNIQDMHF